MTVQKGEQTNQWLVDEKLGVRMQAGNTPDVEVILRVDLKQTVWINHRSGSYALQPWDAGRLPQGGTPIVDPRAAKALAKSRAALEKMTPAARAAAERNLAKRYGRTTDVRPNQLNFQYQRTGQSKRSGPFNTKQLVEMVNRQPTGRAFWVGEYPGWEKLATALQQSLDQFDAIPADERIPFKELGGIAIEMIDRNGTTSVISDIKPLKLAAPQMAPDPQYQQVQPVIFMQQMNDVSQKNRNVNKQPAAGQPGRAEKK
ncbi:MAG: hypothetical protein O2931_12920 [Planctomycetota bacterium]|nr:hypothetical protein [Planctomycetota bacterium]MDA1179686.1 hypothetical protein [Planctomycetota bacterium]